MADSLNDIKAAYYASLGYSGSIADMEYAYYTNPPPSAAQGNPGGAGISGGLTNFGFVRVATPTGFANIGPITNYTHYHRVIEGGTISTIRLGIAVASGNVCAAVYKNTGTGLNAAPANRVATTGSVVCPATPGINDIPLGSTVRVDTGDWISFGADNSTLTVAGMSGVGAFGNSAGMFRGEAVYPAPAVASGTAAPNNTRMFALIGF